ncbi:MAG: 30S ribosomal protein S8 [Candidatus Woesearchaeota archaeon]
MAQNDTLANVLSQINNAVRVGKTSVTTNVSSKLIRQALEIMKEEGYLGDVTEIEDSKGNVLEITLIGRLNSCGVIKPRFAVKVNNFEKFEKRYLPAKDFGLIIVSTNKGLMTHMKAKEENLGGRLVSYCY